MANMADTPHMAKIVLELSEVSVDGAGHCVEYTDKFDTRCWTRVLRARERPIWLVVSHRQSINNGVSRMRDPPMKINLE